MNKADELMEQLYSNCRVTVSEARELSWRKFYKDVGGKENIVNIDGKSELIKILKNSEACFRDIVEDKLSDESIAELVALPPTDIWINDEGNRPIELKKNVISKVI